MRLDVMDAFMCVVCACVFVFFCVLTRCRVYHFHILLISFGKIQGTYAETTQKTDRISYKYSHIYISQSNFNTTLTNNFV